MGVSGVLTLYRTAENSFRSDDLNLLAEIALQLGSYIEKNGGEIHSHSLPELRPELFNAPDTGASCLIQ